MQNFLPTQVVDGVAKHAKDALVYIERSAIFEHVCFDDE